MRFDRFHRTGDQGALLDGDAVHDANLAFSSVDLAAALQDEAIAAEALDSLCIIAFFHMTRAPLVPPAAAVVELQRWSAICDLIKRVPCPPGLPAQARETLELVLAMHEDVVAGRQPRIDDLLARLNDSARREVMANSGGFSSRSQPAEPDSAADLNMQGCLALSEFLDTGTNELLTEAISLLRRATEIVPSDHPERPRYVAEYCEAQYIKCAESYDPDAIDEALRLLRPLTVVNSSNLQAGILSGLGNFLLLRYLQTGVAASLDESLDALRRAVAQSPTPSPAIQQNLATALVRYYVRTNDVGSLTEALTILREALHAGGNDPPRHMILANLGSALLLEYERTSRLEVLDGGICALREAMAMVPTGTCTDCGTAARSFTS
jgi:hypothetical protein